MFKPTFILSLFVIVTAHKLIKNENPHQLPTHPKNSNANLEDIISRERSEILSTTLISSTVRPKSTTTTIIDSLTTTIAIPSITPVLVSSSPPLPTTIIDFK